MRMMMDRQLASSLRRVGAVAVLLMLFMRSIVSGFPVTTTTPRAAARFSQQQRQRQRHHRPHGGANTAGVVGRLRCNAQPPQQYDDPTAAAAAERSNHHDHNPHRPAAARCWWDTMKRSSTAALLGLALLAAGGPLLPPAAHAATTDPSAIVGCLFQKCSVPLGKCILNPKCLANVVCINTCTGRPDEIDCQIECGNLFENDVVGEFNKCVVSDMSCVPQQPDDGRYPVPAKEQTVSKFDTKFFNGKLYITAGQNPLFDTFDCQVHFFTETEPGRFFGKLNWRVTEPDGEFFTRDALQEFYQDPNDPSHLINHDNEYLHYQDDWWIIDYEYDDNNRNVPPFAFVYYRGSNDAWDGYGGVVVYTRDAVLPVELIPRLRAAAAKVNFDWDRDFTTTDNSCPAEPTAGEKLLLRERFAGKAVWY